MRVRMKLVGGREVRAKVRSLGREVGRAMATAAEAAALPLERRWKENVATYYARSGEMGPGGKRGLVETGTYLRSIHHEVESSGPGGAVVLVGTDIVDPPYPFYLEFGTSRMRPKPTARPALDESGEEMRREFSESFRSLMASIG